MDLPTRGNVATPPRVSVGLPVYNAEQFLEESLESLLAQTFTELEIIISDNASTDRTSELCKKYAAADPRIRYVRNDRNVGGVENHNNVFRLARGEYFHLAAHDDRCSPSLIERLVEELDANPDATLCYSGSVSIDADGREGDVRLPDEATFGPPHERFEHLVGADLRRVGADYQYGLIRSRALRETRLFQRYFGSDWVLLAELALRGRFLAVPEPLFFRRYHNGNAYLDYRGRMAWARPELAETGRPTLPHWIKLLDYLRTVRRVSLPPASRLSCYRTTLRWAASRWRGLAKDIVVAGTMLVHGKAWRRRRYEPEQWT